MKKKKSTQQQFITPENYIRTRAKSLPIYKCFINEDWEFLGMANIFITRKHVTNYLSLCIYLVDTKCLGVKDTFYRFNISEEEVEAIMKNNPVKMLDVSYDLVHNIIYASIEFAEQFGFKPHKDFTSITEHFLEEDNDDIPLMEITCGGKNGEPWYMNTGHETPARARQIVQQLEKVAGKDKFKYVLRGVDVLGHKDEFDGDIHYLDPDDQTTETIKTTETIQTTETTETIKT